VGTAGTGPWTLSLIGNFGAGKQGVREDRVKEKEGGQRRGFREAGVLTLRVGRGGREREGGSIPCCPMEEVRRETNRRKRKRLYIASMTATELRGKGMLDWKGIILLFLNPRQEPALENTAARGAG